MGARLTWRNLLQQALDVARQLEHVLWRPRPHDHAVPRVLEPGLQRRVLEPHQDRVRDHLLELCRQELSPLLGIPRRSVRCIKRLYLTLISA